MKTNRIHRIAVIPGDGIGKEVMPEGVRVLEIAAKKFGFELRLESFSFYQYPTRIFFSGAYGLDRFNRTFNNDEVTYGKEWRFYFGILFGFDLD